ncbi:MAG: large repetitive protein [Acidimicrobiaceae bacterium]|nr:large repetitive protein [Acidimicrobiaceae bacterium]
MRIPLKSRRLKAVPAGTWLALIGIAVVALLPFAPPAASAADATSLLTWDKVTSTPAPPARLHAAMALNPADGTTVLFGGRAGSQVLADTWTWDGSAWTARHPVTSPPALESASMAYDNIGRRILLFGGIGSDGNVTSATWAWDGTTWAALAPSSVPPPRYSASIASDAASGTDVLFGGISGGSSLGDTWSWDGNNWVPNTPATSPAARSGAAMTFDAARGAVVLFGGATGSDNRSDTWTWDGANWSQQHPAASPPARNDAALGFDPASQSAILFGGSSGSGTNGTSALGDTWVWNGSTWSTSLALSILPTLSPPARAGAAIAGGPTSQRVVLFGGQPGGANAPALGDTWSIATLTTTPSLPTPSTAVGSSGGSTTTTRETTSTTAVTGPSGTPPTAGKAGPTPATAKAPVPAPLAVAARSVERGKSVKVSGSGFLPGAKITITFHSVRVVVGTTVADARGRFSTTVLVPNNAPPGQHHIEADGATNAGGRAVLVGQVSIMGPRGHHSWVLPALMVALTVLLAAGAGVVLTTSARWHRPHSAT